MDGYVRPPQSTARHTIETLRLAAPLSVALLAQVAMGVTDTVLLGGLGNAELAAGGLGGTIFITTQVVLQGVLAAVSVLVAQARGAGAERDVPTLYWTGMLLTALLAIPAFALFSAVGPLLLRAGEPGPLARDVDAYVSALRWGAPAALLEMGMLRAFMPAIGAGTPILWATLAATPVNGVLCYGLIHGAWGLPAMGLRGAGAASAIVWTGLAVVLLAVVHGPRGRRRFVAWSRPRAAVLGALLRLGVPVAATFAVESGLFLAVSLLIGRLGAAPLAAQHVALNVVTVAFMVPLGIGQAATVRVGFCVGAGDRLGARRAGMVALGLGAAAELAAAVVNLVMPERVAGWFIDSAAGEAFGAAVQLLGVAAVFQVADGVQSVAGGVLRGYGDARVPFLLSGAGYWGIGVPAAWWLALHTPAGAVGAWWGLAAGLLVVAVLLTVRVWRRSGAALRAAG